MSNFEIWMIVLTGATVLCAIIAACIFNTELSVMQGQLEEMRAARIADQRPWISLDADIVGPLSYEGKLWKLPIQYRLQQSGKSPAINVSTFGQIFPVELLTQQEALSGQTAATLVEKRIEQVCSFPEMLSKHKMGWGQVMFPGEVWPNGSKAPLTEIGGQPTDFEGKGPNVYVGQFIVVACVTYGSTLDASEYRTAKVFALFKKTGTKKFDPAGETVEMTDLGFVQNPTSGSYAR